MQQLATLNAQLEKREFGFFSYHLTAKKSLRLRKMSCAPIVGVHTKFFSRDLSNFSQF
jgi:hypothetical protein